MSDLVSQNAKYLDKFLKKYFKQQSHSQLIPPMKYGVLFGGKKIRSTVIFNTSEIFNLKKKDVINICGSVESIHSYSLIHDDLPCMDNDKLRRGKPAMHIKFGESTAILSGNSLLTLAFEMIAEKNYNVKPNKKILILKKLAECVGHVGIAGGQFLDLSYEKKKVSGSKIISMLKIDSSLHLNVKGQMTKVYYMQVWPFQLSLFYNMPNLGYTRPLLIQEIA